AVSGICIADTLRDCGNCANRANCANCGRRSGIGMNHPLMLAQLAGGDGPSAFGPMLMMGAIFAIFYLLIFRPQFQHDRLKEDFRGKLKKGDEVVAAGGLHGRVSDIKGSIVVVDLAPNVRVRVERKTIEPAPARASKADEKESTAS